MDGASDDGARAASQQIRPVSGAAAPGMRLYRSADLFDGQTEVLIEHAGERYRLRCTRQGKLILTK